MTQASTNLGIERLHSVHFAVQDLDAVREFYEEQLGCVPLWRASAELVARSGQRSIVYGAGAARICVSAPVDASGRCKAARYLAQHPEGVMSLAFYVRDIDHTFRVLESRGGTPIADVFRHTAAGYADFEIATPLVDVQIRFVQASEDIFAPGFEALSGQRSATAAMIPWINIDHITSNTRTLAPVIAWWREVMGFEQFWDIQFHTTQVPGGEAREDGSGLKSIVMWDPSSGLKFATNEPLRPFFRASQIEKFIADNRGAGVQHIALLVPAIIPAVDTLRGKGLRFLNAPPAYYDRLPRRFADVNFDITRVKEPVSELQKRSILLDGSSEGYMLQIFTDELRDIAGAHSSSPAFYEVIQRAGDRGFGYGNFRALFESIEALQTAKAQ